MKNHAITPPPRRGDGTRPSAQHNVGCSAGASRSASLDSVFDAGRVGAAEPAGSGSRGGRWHGRDAQGGLRGEQPGLEGGAEEGAG